MKKYVLALALVCAALVAPMVSAQSNPCDTAKLAGNYNAFSADYTFVVCVPKDVAPSKISVIVAGVTKDFASPVASGPASISNEKPYTITVPLPTSGSSFGITTTYSFVSGSTTVTSSQSTSFTLLRPVPTNHAP